MIGYKAPLILMAIAYVAAAPANDESHGQVDRIDLPLPVPGVPGVPRPVSPPNITQILSACPSQCTPFKDTLGNCIDKCLNPLDVDTCLTCVGGDLAQLTLCVTCIATNLLSGVGV